MNAAFGQVADGKVVMECFRELAGLRARRGFQPHGQRAAQGKAQDGGGIGFIFRIESQGEQDVAALVHFLVRAMPWDGAPSRGPNQGQQTGMPPRMALPGTKAALGERKRHSSCPAGFHEVRCAP